MSVVQAVPQQLKIRAAQPLRVLLFTNSVTVGGMEEHVKLLARHLDRSQFVVHAISPRWDATAPFSDALSQLADYHVELTPDRRHGLLAELREIVRFFKQVREWRIDVMHLHSTTFGGQFLAFALAKLAGVRTIYLTEHLAPDAPLPWLTRLQRNLFSRGLSGLVCVSQKNRQARSQYLYTPPQTQVVDNGVDTDDFAPISDTVLAALRVENTIPKDAPIVGTVVRFEPEKGLEYLIDALPAIHKACPDAHFLLVGDGSLRQDLEAQTARHGLSDSVHFAGFQTDPRPYLGLMDVFALPVPVGSMSIGLLEAMAMRRAVVMTFGGEGEAVEHERSGLCAPPRDPDALAKSIIRLLQAPELRARLGEAARRRVEDHFSARQVAARLGALYTIGDSKP